ncbi:signal peptidase 22 kDa subunit [Hygrophoropsis aurantiaca]|uniref:Signal peptidase 22 kDa subunit n=1 Tax=Hygrophoropsis aurantiaca TaxID=72124 RepID=A0ACB8ATV6_9AGAM|nr:signal peptidase 22 kDa subunit [Hygrophoropsis aurantiaca]
MHSIYSRVNAVSGLWSTCLMVLLGAIALSSMFLSADPKGDVSVTSLKVFHGKAKRYPYKKQEFGFVNFNITADLTPLFNWNTKQLFLYLEAEYTNAQGVKNDVVLWDRIVRRKEDAVINFSGKNKYKFRDLSKTFKNVAPAHYALKYNVMPYVGMLTYGEAARTAEPIGFPEAQESMS